MIRNVALGLLLPVVVSVPLAPVHSTSAPLTQHTAYVYPCDGQTRCLTFPAGVNTGYGSTIEAAYVNAMPFDEFQAQLRNCAMCSDPPLRRCEGMTSTGYDGAVWGDPYWDFFSGSWAVSVSWTSASACKTCYSC